MGTFDDEHAFDEPDEPKRTRAEELAEKLDIPIEAAEEIVRSEGDGADDELIDDNLKYGWSD